MCGRFESCRNKGLHAHHPRDCLYFMRDFSVEDLQGFLRDNNVEFETEPAPEQVEAAEEKKNQGENEVVAGDGEAVAKEGTTLDLMNHGCDTTAHCVCVCLIRQEGCIEM